MEITEKGKAALEGKPVCRSAIEIEGVGRLECRKRSHEDDGHQHGQYWWRIVDLAEGKSI